MLRIAKLTDYGIVLLTHFARQPEGTLVTTRDVIRVTGLPEATTSKLLKALTRSGLLDSTRGQAGGYALAFPPEEVTVARIVEALEGPLALTECSIPSDPSCTDHRHCPMSGHWPHINRAVRAALETVSLASISGVPARRRVLEASPGK